MEASGPMPGTVPDTGSLRALIGEYFMFILLAIGLLYMARDKLTAWWNNKKGLAQHQAARSKISEEQREADRQAAMERLRQYAQQCGEADAIAREERKRKEAEERAKMLEKAKQQQKTTGKGPDDENDDLKLPKLPGGSRDTYTPSTSAGYSGYRPTGFRRPAPSGG
jgi:hypothetical protein